MKNHFPIIKKELNKTEMEFLQNRFFHLMDDEGKFNSLKNYYSESHRSYHNLSHIYSMFQLLDESELESSDDLEWAIFYHDIIYNSKKKDNEEKSAEVFKKEFEGILNEENIGRVYDLIMATQHHEPIEDHSVSELLLDLDLCILSSDLELYQSYATEVREEYKWVPKILYRKGRKKVLQHFLDREQIYFTDYFFRRGEKKARENLKWELNEL